MKVKEYIEYLQTLDQDKDIYVVNDYGYVFDPMVDDVAYNDCMNSEGTIEYKKGDYLIIAS